MYPTLRTPVPSRNLLRFLRSQHEIAFFSPSHVVSRPLAFSNACRAASPACRKRRLSTSCGRSAATLEASVFDLEPLLRRLPRRDARKSLRTLFSTSQARQKQPGSAKGETDDFQDDAWSSSTKNDGKPPKPENLASGDDFGQGAMFSQHQRTVSAKASLDPRLRCTEVDEHGEVILVDGEFKKTELIAKYGLLPRDLRKIDSSNLPHILVRPSAILLNLLHLKVLIKYDRVLLFDVYGSKTSYPQSAFMYDLQGKLQQKNSQASSGLPYEFRALEAVLTSVTSEMEADFEAVREPVMRILSELEDDIDRQKLRLLLILSKRVSTFEQKAKLVRDAIEDLLEADDDLSDMYLTEKTHDLHRDLDDHTEVEMLLESYHKLTDEIVQEAGNLVSGIRNTEEIVRAILDANRNALMLLDLKFSVGTLGLAMGTFLAGLYGMNLENFIEETNWGFAGVTGVSTLFSLLVCWYGLVKLRKVQRIKMESADRPHLPRRSMLHHDDSLLGLMDSRSREATRRINMQRNVAQNAPVKKRGWFL